MPPGDPIRVFLCDDVEAFRALVRDTLAEDPAIEVVGEAADGEAGVAGVEDLQPDVVLLDVGMPRLGGLDAIPRIRHSSPRTSIVALSAFESERMAQPMLDRGADRYLEKGTGADELRRVIHAVAAED